MISSGCSTKSPDRATATRVAKARASTHGRYFQSRSSGACGCRTKSSAVSTGRTGGGASRRSGGAFFVLAAIFSGALRTAWPQASPYLIETGPGHGQIRFQGERGLKAPERLIQSAQVVQAGAHVGVVQRVVRIDPGQGSIQIKRLPVTLLMES